MATDVDTKEFGLIESGSENAEKTWLGMVVGFVAINQFSMDSDFGVCEDWCTTRWICTAKCAQDVRCCP